MSRMLWPPLTVQSSLQWWLLCCILLSFPDQEELSDADILWRASALLAREALQLWSVSYGELGRSSSPGTLKIQHKHEILPSPTQLHTAPRGTHKLLLTPCLGLKQAPVLTCVPFP